MKFNRYKLGTDFTFEDDKVILAPEVLKNFKLKKITATKLGSLFGQNAYKSTFRLWCEMFDFFEEDKDPFFVEAGKEVEDKVRKYAEKKFNVVFDSYDEELLHFDLFKDNKIFGGIPDGEEKDSSGNVLSILEIKTAQIDSYKWEFRDNQYWLVKDKLGVPVLGKRNEGLKHWFKDGRIILPPSYQYQLGLYLHLRGLSVGHFAIAFLKYEDYLEPKKVKFNCEFNNFLDLGGDVEKVVERDGYILAWVRFQINTEDFRAKIFEATKWYEDFIIKGVSPKLTEEDLNWFRYGYPDIGK